MREENKEHTSPDVIEAEAKEASAEWAEEKKEEWECPHCLTRNTGRFCSECGAPKPEHRAPEWHEPPHEHHEEKKQGRASRIFSWIGAGAVVFCIGFGGGAAYTAIHESKLEDRIEALEENQNNGGFFGFGNEDVPDMFRNGNGFGGNGPEGGGEVQQQSGAALGLSVQESEDGVVIAGFSSNSKAEDAGLQEGDIIEKLDDTEVSGMRDIRSFLKEHEAGDTVSVTVKRDGKDVTVHLELVEKSTH